MLTWQIAEQMLVYLGMVIIPPFGNLKKIVEKVNNISNVLPTFKFTFIYVLFFNVLKTNL